MSFHLKRVVHFIDIHHLSILLSSISCTYTPCSVRKCICVMKYLHIFTLRLIYINFDHARFWSLPVFLVVHIGTWSGAYIYPHSSYLLLLQSLFAIHTHWSSRCLVYLNTISLIVWYIRIALPILPILIDSLSTIYLYHIYVHIYTHIWIYIYVFYQLICVLWRTWFYCYTHVYDYIVAHIYIYICINV